MSYQPLFKSAKHQKHFDDKGFVILDFLREKELKLLQDFYAQHLADIPKKEIYESSRENNAERNNEIQSIISQSFAWAYAEYFNPGHTYFGGTFMVKAPGNSTTLPLHQDWSIIDEAQFNTVFIWCPIVPIRKENGGLFVLPGSHKFFHNYRSGSLPTPRVYLPKFLQNLVFEVELEPGQCIAYSTNIFHGSHPNVSTEDRVIATGQVVQAGADLIYYRKSPEQGSKVEAYRMPAETYLNEIRTVDEGGIPNNAELIEVLPNRNEPVTSTSLTFKVLRYGLKNEYFKTLLSGGYQN
jgi:hypothetical protein